jgi:signal transduction histidine kinase
LATTLSVLGEPSALSAGQDMAAYRIVQEALTNVLKHAGPGARATVRVEYRADVVRIEVFDDGRGTTSADLARATGQGLVGMRERTDMFDGTLRAGPRPGGGFRVLATMPLRPATAPRLETNA